MEGGQSAKSPPGGGHRPVRLPPLPLLNGAFNLVGPPSPAKRAPAGRCRFGVITGRPRVTRWCASEAIASLPGPRLSAEGRPFDTAALRELAGGRLHPHPSRTTRP